MPNASDQPYCSNSPAVATVKHAFECAERVGRFIAALEARSDQGADAAKLRHDLRSSLGTLRCALDVLNVSPPASNLATEAMAIALRHAAQLELKISEQGGAPWPAH